MHASHCNSNCPSANVIMNINDYNESKAEFIMLCEDIDTVLKKLP